jgi:hypothetical protein
VQNIEQKLKAVDTALVRWQSRLVRASNMVSKLTKKRRRLQLAATIPPDAKPVAVVKVKVPVETDHLSEAAFTDFVQRGQAAQAAVDDLTIPKLLKRDPNADALKAMNKRIEQRAAERSKKPAKAKAPSKLIAKAMAERDAINEAAKK